MKTIFIETVSNGWIVRLHDSHREYVSQPLAVFNRMIDLQEALPDLLAEEKLIRPPQQVTPGGDRRPETIGGNELTPSA